MKSIKVFSLAFIMFYLPNYYLNGQTQDNSDSTANNAYNIGYDSIPAENLTHSHVRVQNDDFMKGFIGSPEQLIQGKMAGVQVLSSNGEPGSGAQINIRGYSSISLNNNPLIIIDGFPLSEFDNSPAGFNLGLGSSVAKNPLNFLDPNNIKSIEVIKDLSAAAIYGARGANGVIIITTKSGQDTNQRFEFNTMVGFSRATRRYDLLTANEYVTNLPEYGADSNELDNGENTDWQDQIANKRLSTRYDLAYSNTYKNGNYRASFGLENQQGVIKNSILTRPNLAFNLNHKMLDDKLKIRFRLNGSQVQNDSPFLSNYTPGLLGAVYNANPTLSNNPENQEPGQLNPSSLLSYYQDKTSTIKGIAYLSLDYELIPDLNIVINNGYDLTHSSRDQVFTSDLQAQTIFGNGRAALQEMNSKSYLLEAMLQFNKDFGGHHINAMGGFAYQNFDVAHTTLQGFGFQGENGLNTMGSSLEEAANIVRNSISGSFQQWGIDRNQLFINRLSPLSTETDINNFPDLALDAMAESQMNQVNELQSFFGRFNYDFADKYFVSAVLRVDGSTRFAPDHKYGFFPGISAGWLLSNEDFMNESVSRLKLRAGFGIAGNQALPHNAYSARQAYSQPLINSDGQVLIPGLVNVGFENPDLKWEQTQEITIGMDFGFWENKLLGTLNFYDRNTTNLVFVGSSGPGISILSNIDGNIINRGVEFNLDYNLIKNTQFNWDLGFNIAYNKNELQNYAGIINTGYVYGQGLQGAYVQRMEEGQPLFTYYLREFDSFNEDGFSEFANNGNPQATSKGPIPIYNLGFYSNWSYRKFDLGVHFTGQLGHYLYNNTSNAFFTAGNYANGRNVTTDVIASDESPFNASEVSTKFLEKADFLRLQNLVLGYNFSMENSKAFRSIRVSAIGQNLLTFTQYSGIDPEVFNNDAGSNLGGLGIDYLAYPRAKTYSLGVNLVF